MPRFTPFVVNLTYNEPNLKSLFRTQDKGVIFELKVGQMDTK